MPDILSAGKNEKCPHLLQDKLVVFPPKLILQGIFELKIRIFNFYQCTRGNLTFLDILWNITFTEKSVIEEQLFSAFPNFSLVFM